MNTNVINLFKNIIKWILIFAIFLVVFSIVFSFNIILIWVLVLLILIIVLMGYLENRNEHSKNNKEQYNEVVSTTHGQLQLPRNVLRGDVIDRKDFDEFKEKKKRDY